ncbi:MAG: hypothetical protein ACI8Q1_003357 [Parvicella sp.]|jgi:hypothetical protein
MKILNTALILISTLILISCGKSEVEGKYIRIKANESGGLNSTLSDAFGGLVSELDFKGKHCNFTYFGMQMSGEYKVDGGYVYIHTTGELGTLALQITDSQTLDGEGWVSGTFKKIDSFRAKNKTAIGYFKTKSELNMRTGPGTEFAKIEVLSKGEEVKVVEELDDGWVEIEKGGYRGYVSKDYLTKK